MTNIQWLGTSRVMELASYLPFQKKHKTKVFHGAQLDIDYLLHV